MGFDNITKHICKTYLYFFVFRIIGIGVVGILDVDIFGVRLRLLFAVISPDWLRRVFWALRLILLPLSVAF